MIAEAVASLALELDAEAVVHGCTGKGNDQLRFELAFKANYPGVTVIAPLRDKVWTREEEIAYALERGIPITAKKGSPYSIDENLFGRSIEAGHARGSVDGTAGGAVQAHLGARTALPRRPRSSSASTRGFPIIARRRGARARGSDRRAEREGRPPTASAGST